MRKLSGSAAAGLIVLIITFFASGFDVPSSTAETDLTADVNAFSSGLNLCNVPIQPVTLSNPTVVSNCTRAGLQAALNTGGHITFSCGPNPTTINIDQPLVITDQQDTVIDGQGLITLDGGNQNRIIQSEYSANPKTLTLQHIALTNGRAASGGDLTTNSGGAIRVGHPGTRLHIINSTLANNSTRDTTFEDNQGGAIFVSNSYETIIVGSVLENNTAGNGGAFGGIATGLLIFNSRFSNNQAVDTTSGGIVRGYGGAIHLDGVRNSYNPNSRHEFTVCGSIFENNQSVRGGGAIGSVVSDGYGTKATFSRSTFSQNEVTGLSGQYGQGGAIYHIEDDVVGASGEDNFEINQSTFVGNMAGRQGGAVWFMVLGSGRVHNSTFESNTTTAPFNSVGQAGAMAVLRGIIDISNSTFANNHAAYQGGAIHAGGSGDPNLQVTLRNTIFLNNTLNEQDLPSETRWQGYHTNRPLIDGGQNIQHPRFKPTYNNDVNNLITNNPIFADPLLAPLANNGGYNDTMALLSGSPAINSGAAGCPAVDQRGAARISTCDIGAYEFAGVPPNARRLDLQAVVSDLNGTLPYTQTVAFEMTLTNQDTAPISGAEMSVTLPSGVAFDGWVSQAGASQNGATVSWGPQSLDPGETVEVIFTMDVVGTPGAEVSLTADYSSTAGDSGSQTASFVIGQPPQVRVYLPFVKR